MPYKRELSCIFLQIVVKVIDKYFTYNVIS